MKKERYFGAYSQLLYIQKVIHRARVEVEANFGCYALTQTTWMHEKELMKRFLCEVISLIHVQEICSDVLKQEAR